mgnify:CR=1 FL=1
MMNNIAIKVSHLTKVYKLYDKPVDRLKESLHPLKKKYHKEFYALNDVSFEIKKGETVGIIGKNGAGKSTLLKIITGVLTPSKGHVHVDGRIASLLELGAGFNPEYTGMENIYLQGTLMGYTKEEMESKIQAILDFADIGEFVYQPVKSYSSGMFARLAFSIAINVNPDILIVDEALSVGDIRFQQKCIRKMEDLKSNGVTVLFVSHDTGSIRKLCKSAILINDGVIVNHLDVETVLNKYFALSVYDQDVIVEKKSDNEKSLETVWEDVKNIESFGSREALITGVSFTENNQKINQLVGTPQVCFKMKIYAQCNITNPIFGFQVNDIYGNAIFGINTYIYNHNKFESLKEGQSAIIDIKFIFPNIKTGDYTISAAIAEGTQTSHTQHHWINDCIIFKYIPEDIFSKSGFFINLNQTDIIIEAVYE